MSDELEFDPESEPMQDDPAGKGLAASSTNLMESVPAAIDHAEPLAAGGFGTVTLEPEFNLQRTLRTALRGRLRRVIGLGILLGGLFGYAGWHFVRPTYTSTGLVHIAYQLPQVLVETDQNGPMQMFDTFMQSQQLVVTSRLVLDDAVQDPIWRTTGHEVPADPGGYFNSHLKVTIPPHSEYMQISVSDPDPGLAAAAVTAVINAYADHYEKHELELENARKGALSEIRGPLETTMAQFAKQVDSIASQYGTTDLSEFYNGAVGRVTRTQIALEEIRMAMAVAPPDGSLPGTMPSTQPIAKPPVELTVEQIASRDPTMHEYLERLTSLQNDLQSALITFGENHPNVLRLTQQVADAQAQVNAYAEQCRQFYKATDQNLGDPGHPIATEGQSLQTLRQKEAGLSQLLDQEQVEMKDVGDKKMQLDKWKGDLADAKERLDKVDVRSEALQSEAMLDGPGGRLSITSTGEIPLGPSSDPRLKAAAASALFGAGLPAMCFILASLLASGKYRYSEDAHDSIAAEIPLIGIVPALHPNPPAGSTLSQAAAQSIHQIRVSLASRETNGDGATVYLVTSAAAGEGKTSLSMSIGLSFAASGVRTLLIDCDLLGRQLTSSLKALDKSGLHEALASGTLKKRIRKAGNNLYYVPSGKVGREDACSVSPARLRLLLAQARRHFEVVIIDSGPILGSVEAAVLAREVDGVLFAVSQNQRRALVERAIRRLASLDARLDGLIFNRARAEDFETSSYGSSYGRSTIPKETNGHDTDYSLNPNFAGFGLLVQAVAATTKSNVVASQDIVVTE